MTASLSTRLIELAFGIRDLDPELEAHLLALDKEWRQKHKHVKAVRKVRLAEHGKAGVFYAPAEMVKESDE